MWLRGYYFHLRESPPPLDIPTPIPAPTPLLGDTGELGAHVTAHVPNASLYYIFKDDIKLSEMTFWNVEVLFFDGHMGASIRTDIKDEGPVLLRPERARSLNGC